MLSPTFVASLLTLAPAMGAAAYILRRYEGYFDQGRLFVSIIFGLFAGLLSKALEVFWFKFDNPAGLYNTSAPFASGQLVFSFAYTSAGYAMLAAAMMMAFLGFRRFRTRKDAPYYGVAFGLAMGAMWSLQLIALKVSITGLPLNAIGILTAVEYLLVGAGLVLAYGASGAWIGKASADGHLRRGILFGTLWLIPALALYWIYFVFSTGLLPALLIAAFGAASMWLAQTRVLDRIVPPEIREQLAKQRRRDLRKS